jgi:cobalt-zinc-cadmium efflux system outer membrane protein
MSDRQVVRYEVAEPGLDSLIRLALSRRPDLRAAEVDVQAQEASLGAARAAGKPTLAVGALYSRARDNLEVAGQPVSDLDNTFGLGVVIGLPLLNRNQGEVARAQAAQAQAALRVASTRQAVERDVRVAAQQAALAASQIETLQGTILPANQGALRIAETAFGRGQVNILQVLQVQRAYVESTTALLEAMRQFATAMADLEAAIGGPVP